MATASTDKTVGLWHAETGLLRNRLRAFKSAVLAVKFLPFGPLVCAGSLDKACAVFHILTGELKFSLSAHTSGITSLAISADGVLLTGSSDADVRVWDLRLPWPEVLSLPCPRAFIQAHQYLACLVTRDALTSWGEMAPRQSADRARTSPLINGRLIGLPSQPGR